MILNYLQRQYIPHLEEFATWAIVRNRNFNIRSTSRVEGLHAQMKQYLLNRLGSLKRLGDAIRTWTVQKEQDYQIQLQDNGQRVTVDHKTTPMFMGIAFDISWKALELMWKQYTQATHAFLRGQVLLPHCTGQFSRQWIPCSHMMTERLHEKKAFILTDISSHWHLHRSGPRLAEPLSTTISDPLVVFRTNEQRLAQRAHTMRTGGWPEYASVEESNPTCAAQQVSTSSTTKRPHVDNSTKCDPRHDVPKKPKKRQRRAKKPQVDRETVARMNQLEKQNTTLINLLATQASQPTVLESPYPTQSSLSFHSANPAQLVSLSSSTPSHLSSSQTPNQSFSFFSST